MQDYPSGTREPAWGLYGELTVEEARWFAQKWLAQVRPGYIQAPTEQQPDPPDDPRSCERYAQQLQ